MKTMEKLENGGFNLDEFSTDQKSFIMAVAKMSYADGLDDGISRSDVLCAIDGLKNDLGI